MEEKKPRVYSRMVEMGLKTIEKKFNPYVSAISITLCVIAAVVIMNGTIKVMKLGVTAAKIQESKTIHDTITVEKINNVNVNDCDTIYIVDGIRMRKAQ